MHSFFAEKTAFDPSSHGDGVAVEYSADRVVSFNQGHIDGVSPNQAHCWCKLYSPKAVACEFKRPLQHKKVYACLSVSIMPLCLW
jgi:hypothetical protein